MGVEAAPIFAYIIAFFVIPISVLFWRGLIEDERFKTVGFGALALGYLGLLPSFALFSYLRASEDFSRRIPTSAFSDSRRAEMLTNWILFDAHVLALFIIPVVALIVVPVTARMIEKQCLTIRGIVIRFAVAWPVLALFNWKVSEYPPATSVWDALCYALAFGLPIPLVAWAFVRTRGVRASISITRGVPKEGDENDGRKNQTDRP